MISELDKVMADAWPARELRGIGPWVARYSSGVTRRANSVLAIGSPSKLDDAIDAAEQFYGERGAPAVFQVSEASAGPEVSHGLAERGYEPTAATEMLWGDLAQLRTGASPRSHLVVHVEPEPSDAWFEAYAEVEGDRWSAPDERAVVRDQLLRPACPVSFVTVVGSDGVAAVGQVVVSGPWACGQCLATVPSQRRQGAGQTVFAAAVDAAAALGAQKFFVAVMADNTASLALSLGTGLQRSHSYSYWQ